MGLALLAQAGMPQRFWDDVFVATTFLINRIPSKLLHNCTPYEKLFKIKPNYHELKVFGCLCYLHIRPYNSNKLEYRSEPSTFLGCSPHHKGYKVLLKRGKVVVTRDVVFNESCFPFLSSAVSPVSTDIHSSFPSYTSVPISLFNPCSPSVAIPPSSPSPSIFTEPSPLITQDPSPQSSPLPNPSASVSSTSPSPTVTPPPPISHPMVTRAKAGIFKPKLYHLSSSNDPSTSTPKSALAALSIPIWKRAMLDEFLALLRNKTWVLTKLPPGKNLIGSTWVFKLKKDCHSDIARHEARLVAQGFARAGI